jgi:hypothetical protein
MKSTLTAFAALAALALPAGLPTLAFAQDQDQEQEQQAERSPPPPPSDSGPQYQPDDSYQAPPVRNWVSERPEVQSADLDRRRGGRDYGGNDGDQDRGDWNRGDNGWGNGDGGWNRPDEPTPPPEMAPAPPAPPLQDNGGGGGWNGDGDNNGNGGRDWNRGDNDGQDWNRGNDGQDWNRGNDRRDRDGGWNGGAQESAPAVDNGNGPQRVAPRGSFADSCSGSYVNQGRLYADCRDPRGNVRGTSIELARCSSSDIGNDNGRLVCHNVRGDFEGRDRNNGGWNRDRNNDGRNWRGDRYGRRDYGGFNNRWNQNDWRRDWNRGRSNDWWRNDRSFRGYSGYRFGFYFAPNYGYYSVPRNYWGQRWYRGDYLPSIFWRYRLSDYRTYGLGYPPPGTQWVAVDTTIYLIDSYDGYILEVIYDAWRW